MDNRRKICIVGGGFGGLFTALNLSGSASVTLLSRDEHFLFTPMLYEYLSGEVEAWQMAPAYKELLGDEIDFIRGVVTGIDLETCEVSTAGNPHPIEYDLLVLAVGSVTNYEGIEGAERFSLPFRRLEDADALRARLTEVLDGIAPDSAPEDARQMATVVVVGGDASGIELSTKLADMLHAAFHRRGIKGEPRVLIIEVSESVGSHLEDPLRSTVEEALSRAGVEVHTRAKVVEVYEGGLTIEHNGERKEINAAAVIWAGGVKANPLVEDIGLEKNDKGLLIVEDSLRVRGRENVFAIGDIAHYPNAAKGLGGTAQLAYQEADLLAENLLALMEGSPTHTRHFDELGEALSLGTESGAVEVRGHVLSGLVGRETRFAMYAARLPTWGQRLSVAPRWFFGASEPRPL